jgi:hypothetical protein
MLYMFRAISPPIIRSSRTVHTASAIFQACLLLPLAVAAMLQQSVFFCGHYQRAIISLYHLKKINAVDMMLYCEYILKRGNILYLRSAFDNGIDCTNEMMVSLFFGFEGMRNVSVYA